MEINEIAKNIANLPYVEWDNLQELLDDIELEGIERNLTNICFLAGMYQDDVFYEDEIDDLLQDDFGLTTKATRWCQQLVSVFIDYRKNRIKNTNGDFLNITNYPDDTGLPKSIIVRVDEAEERFGITDINCTLSKEHSYTSGLGEVKLFGEVRHHMLTEDILMFVIVYNDKDKIIEFQNDIRLSKNSKVETIECTLNFPIDENISAIYLRPVIDPCLY